MHAWYPAEYPLRNTSRPLLWRHVLSVNWICFCINLCVFKRWAMISDLCAVQVLSEFRFARNQLKVHVHPIYGLAVRMGGVGQIIIIACLGNCPAIYPAHAPEWWTRNFLRHSYAGRRWPFCAARTSGRCLMSDKQIAQANQTYESWAHICVEGYRLQSVAFRRSARKRNSKFSVMDFRKGVWK